MALSCRYYKHAFPEEGDVVMATVVSVGDIGVYVSLNEYDGKEALLLPSNLRRRRMIYKPLSKMAQTGSREVCTVIRVDEGRGYIDLSARRISEEDVTATTNRYSKAKSVNKTLCHVAEQLHYSPAQLEELYSRTAWYLDDKLGEPGRSFDVFRAAARCPEVLDECDLSDDERELLLIDIVTHLGPHTVTVRADLEVVCTTPEGIDAVKRALKSGLQVATDSLPIRIQLVASPWYTMTTRTDDFKGAVDILLHASGVIEECITNAGGNFNIIKKPHVSASEDLP